jgi:hypothetical protein
MTDTEHMNPETIDIDPEIQPNPDEAPVQREPDDAPNK